MDGSLWSVILCKCLLCSFFSWSLFCSSRLCSGFRCSLLRRGSSFLRRSLLCSCGSRSGFLSRSLLRSRLCSGFRCSLLRRGLLCSRGFCSGFSRSFFYRGFLRGCGFRSGFLSGGCHSTSTSSPPEEAGWVSSRVHHCSGAICLRLRLNSVNRIREESCENLFRHHPLTRSVVELLSGYQPTLRGVLHPHSHMPTNHLQVL